VSGQYVLDRSGVSFTVSFKDNGSGGKKSTPDTFGIHIDARPADDQPALPNSAPQAIKGGNLTVS
jgi:hypothetical protein